MLLFILSLAWGTPSIDEILKKIDQNMSAKSRTASLEMNVQKGKRIKKYKMRSHVRGNEAAIEFQAPARDRGTKMLKKEGELWMFLPSIEKTQKISGHMLRKGMMGSDMSYEDMLTMNTLFEDYDAQILAEEELGGVPCYKIEMIAKDASVTYAKRISWVEKEKLVPRKENLYAVSGMMIKELLFEDIKDFEDRSYPTKIVVNDTLQKNTTTTVLFVQIDFTVSLADEFFSRRWLDR
ncbi:MAG: outer membrane lipoprotein-sorting protein [Myxococcota bacterium]|nr:outer membrane lipoprotein-sorting protein [Myxococcota bacterium]